MFSRSETPLLLVIDGQNAAYRISAMMPKLHTSKLKPVEIIYSFLRLLHGMLELFEPDRVLICWDQGDPVARLAIFPGYKAKRHAERAAAGGDFVSRIQPQLKELKAMLSLMGIATIEMRNIEADDLIGNACEIPGYDKLVVSNDEDMLQLVRPGVDVFTPLKKIRYRDNNFMDLVGMHPQDFLHMRALCGDETDEIPPCTFGVGPKSARKIILESNRVDSIWDQETREYFRHLRPILYRKLYTDPDAVIKARRNLRLMDLSLTISETAMMAISRCLQNLAPVDKMGVLRYFRDNEFNSLTKIFSNWITPFERLNRDAQDEKNLAEAT